MSLSTPESVQKLQTALHDKAKGSPSFRFYALYDKVYRKDVLAFAYECCKANGGAAGVDGQTFEDIEAYGEERWSDELAQELKNRTYQPLPVRRVYIPKPDGKQRPLGVPAIRDRAAEMAAVLVLEPIFEAAIGLGLHDAQQIRLPHVLGHLGGDAAIGLGLPHPLARQLGDRAGARQQIGNTGFDDGWGRGQD